MRDGSSGNGVIGRDKIADRPLGQLDHRDSATYTGAPFGAGPRLAGVAELVDARVLGTRGVIRGGSSPSARTSGTGRIGQ
jgi:hypothetical protein